MNKMVVKEQAPARERGLRRRGDGRDNYLAGFLRNRDGLHREMDRLFDEFLPGLGGSLSLFEPWADGDLVPSVDQTEDDKAYHFTVELPGMDQKDVEVSFSDGVLTVSGEKKQEKEEKGDGNGFYRRERSYGAFRRCLPVAGGVDESKIDASFSKGVLSIRLPKTKEAQKKARKIAVKAG